MYLYVFYCNILLFFFLLECDFVFIYFPPRSIVLSFMLIVAAILFLLKNNPLSARGFDHFSA